MTKEGEGRKGKSMATKKTEVVQETEELKDVALNAENAENEEAAVAPDTEKAEAKPKKATPKKEAKKNAKEEPAEEVGQESDTGEEEAADDKADEGAPDRRRKRGYLTERKRAIPKDATEDEKITYMTSRDTFSGEIATKEKRKELLSGERVVTMTGFQPAETLESIRDAEYKELKGSATQGRILQGEIIGVRQSDPDRPDSMVLADVLYKTGSFKVSIPSNLLFDYDEEEYVGTDGAKEIMALAQQRISTSISFVPAFVQEADGICFGDRLRAMSMIGVQRYLKTRPGEDCPDVIPGCLVESRIVTVAKNFIIVDALGVDIKIPQDELSYLHIGDARNSFTLDKTINVKILSISDKTVTHGRNTYHLVKAKGSIKQAYSNQRAINFNHFPVGTTVSARITYINEDGNVFCEINGGKMDCLCRYPKGGNMPAVGQKRAVRITHRDEEKQFLFGEFVSG